MASKETKIEVLDELREFIVRDLQPDKHFAFLRSKMVFDEEDCEEIMAKSTRRKKGEKFLDILATKGESGFDYFCESFIVGGKTQLHLFNQILDAFEEKVYENEVEASSRPQPEFINMDVLNEQLPRPGEPGAPCLPSHTSYIFSEQALQMNGNIPPPPYST